MFDQENLLNLSNMKRQEKSSKVQIILIILLVITAIVSLGFLVYFYFINVKNSESIESVAEEIPKTDSSTTQNNYVDDVYVDEDDEEILPPEPPQTSFKSHPNYKMFSNVPPISANFRIRIQNSNKTFINEFPWTVALFGVPAKNLSATPKYFCAGSLINENWIVTAGHCIPNQHDKRIKITSIRLGDHNLTSPIDCDLNGKCSPPIQEYFNGDFIVFPHQNYSTDTLQNDIGLIKLLRPADTKQENVKLIRLPLDDEKVPKEVLVAGWGLYDHGRKPSDVLMKGLLKTFDAEECHGHFKDTINYSSVSLTSRQFCASGKNARGDILTCKGDSGAAAFYFVDYSFTLYGLTSWGTGDRYQGCGHNREPTVFIKIYEYINWILDVTYENKN